jgi:hypothetical protein
MIRDQAVYGYCAEFDDPDQVLAAAKATYAAGFRKIDAFTPFPIHGLSEAVGFHRTWVPLIVLCGGLFGCVGVFALCSVYDTILYPMNIGGRPHLAWPAFIIPMFEGTVLCASLSAVLGMLFLNGLPRPYHPLFNVPQFELASRNRFFLVIKAPDPQFDLDRTREFMQSLNPLSVALVPSAPPTRKVTNADLAPPWRPGAGLPAEPSGPEIH